MTTDTSPRKAFIAQVRERLTDLKYVRVVPKYAPDDDARQTFDPNNLYCTRNPIMGEHRQYAPTMYIPGPGVTRPIIAFDRVAGITRAFLPDGTLRRGRLGLWDIVPAKHVVDWTGFDVTQIIGRLLAMLDAEMRRKPDEPTPQAVVAEQDSQLLGKIEELNTQMESLERTKEELLETIGDLQDDVRREQAINAKLRQTVDTTNKENAQLRDRMWELRDQKAGTTAPPRVIAAVERVADVLLNDTLEQVRGQARRSQLAPATKQHVLDYFTRFEAEARIKVRHEWNVTIPTGIPGVEE